MIYKKYFIHFLIVLIFLSSINAQKKLSDVVSDTQNDEYFEYVQPPEQLIITDYAPNIFNGIWEGQDRYIMFQEKNELSNLLGQNVEIAENNYIWIYLKLFYGWYTDRASEKFNRKNTKNNFDRNDAVFRDIQDIKIQFEALINSENCCAFEIIITYPNVKEKTVIPVAIIDDKLFLDFAIKSNELALTENIFNKGESDAKIQLNENNDFNVEKNELLGSWSRCANVNGIKVSKPIVKDNLTSLYITSDSVYYIRYWKTSMPYTNDKAFFSDGKLKYEVPKHIKSAGNVYTCVNGRSLTIRNVERKSLPLLDFTMNKNCDVIAFGKPYLTKIFADCSVEQMMKIVKVNNSRRAPDPPPVLPPSNLDWHLEDITRLELNNQIIQAVRQRQKEFYLKYQLGLKF